MEFALIVVGIVADIFMEFALALSALGAALLALPTLLRAYRIHQLESVVWSEFEQDDRSEAVGDPSEC